MNGSTRRMPVVVAMERDMCGVAMIDRWAKLAMDAPRPIADKEEFDRLYFLWAKAVGP